MKTIYKVLFKVPPKRDKVTEYFFTSVAAIYEYFTPQQIGCTIAVLYATRVSAGNAYDGKKVTITQHKLHDKKRGARKGAN